VVGTKGEKETCCDGRELKSEAMGRPNACSGTNWENVGEEGEGNRGTPLLPS